MIITKQLVAEQLSGYLNHETSKEQIVVWCEHQMQEATFESDAIQQVVARLGIMDADNFDVSYEELSDMLGRLGYKLKVDVVQ